MNRNVIREVREKSPLIHHLTNQVVMNFTANGLLSFGGIPAMANAVEEAYDMAMNANGLLINIGTITPLEVKAMIAAGKAANEKGIPVVLDPVGVASTPFRDTAVKQVLHEVKPAVIKGNAGEMAYLAGIPWETKGPDSVGEGNSAEVAEKVAAIYDTAAVVTGKVDMFCIGNDLGENTTGHPFLTKITGAGCLLGSILAACLTTDQPLKQQINTALSFYGAAAEYAACLPDVSGPGTFLPCFIDALSLDVGKLEVHE
ncbi:hydroxyethylthiazole kinase [Virgibacillus dakarensis]|uniref:Hydroxyethylthiazole kinase n=1 Tax=Lentibacillus populi TaxID=1827502 RepID=A0A9W5TXJ3_9BACI|nr:MULTISPECIES: hydroxyethylthiazole kinase [Bacillaceae]MBT2218266.1 hydroxyethylthiazole kinase [Virgibacillus dakarensis]MTW84464.1 hydroxyethylthiazole kinase [Virgibacillus dakarensis]GGB42691.1 hydroxyethylthiazole kinase [Lentibacillus populi]